jgi:hypothetical protein
MTDGTGLEATICDDMTVAEAIAVLQRFNQHAPLILEAVLPSGEVHSLPLKVFRKHLHDPVVGMVMRCHPDTTPGQQTLSELPSKIIQIQSASNPGDGNCGPHTQLFALCEDGTVWCQYHSSGRSNVPNDGLWHRIAG